jgi:hypothetical protein
MMVLRACVKGRGRGHSYGFIALSSFAYGHMCALPCVKEPDNNPALLILRHVIVNALRKAYYQQSYVPERDLLLAVIVEAR